MQPHKNKWLPVSAAAVLATGLALATPAYADNDTLRIVDTFTMNGFDVGNEKTTWASYQLSWAMCDRLFTFGVDEYEPGYSQDDPFTIKGELADSWKYNSDNTVLTVSLKPGAKFHNGDPVTAADVAWSLARAAVTPRTKNQMKIGGLTREDQFSVVDERTVQIKLDKPNRFLVMDLVVPMAVIFNSKLIKKNAASDDPWGLNWAMDNSGGICSGAYKVSKFKVNESFTLERNEDWVGGQKPEFKTIVYQTVKDTSSIAALVERGRADVSLSVGLKELIALRKRGKVNTKVASTKWRMNFLAFDTTKPMFSNKAVRQALAMTVPYKAWHDSTFFSTGTRLDGGKSKEPGDIQFPQPFPYSTDLQAAKTMLEEAGVKSGTAFPYAFPASKAALFEPLAVLWKESLQSIGYDLDIQKQTPALFSEGRNNDKLPMFSDGLGAWLGGSPDYFFRVFYSGDWRDNAGNYSNSELASLLDKNIATFDKDQYASEVKQMISWAMDDLPIMPLRLNTQNWVTSKQVTGIHTSFHGRWDFRLFRKAK